MTYKLLGDPHLGRAFIRGVPLARRGDREKTQWADFTNSLMEVEGVDVHVCMGDIFDRWTVPYTVIFQTSQIYRRAATQNPDVQYYLIQGNHDASRDLERVSAFRLLKAILSDVPNIHIVDHETGPLRDEFGGVMIPWSPLWNAARMVEEYEDQIAGADTAFGHWDVVAIGDTDNLLPAEALKALGIQKAITGHDHTAREIELEGLPVVITGSMQPYSFAEDPEGWLYITVTLSELEALPEDELLNKCVRVVLAPGESLDRPIDCLQLRIKHEGSPDEDQPDLSVMVGDFSIERLFDEVMTEVGVSPDFILSARQRIEDERAKE